MVTPGALECARRLLFVAVRDLDRGVHADHDRLPQVAVGHPRGRDPPVPGLDQPPHVPAGPRPRRRDPFPLVRADLVQRPPQRRVRGHRPEQLVLIAQHRQIRQHPATVGDQHRGVGQHPAEAKSSGDLVGDERAVWVAGVVA